MATGYEMTSDFDPHDDENFLDAIEHFKAVFGRMPELIDPDSDDSNTDHYNDPASTSVAGKLTLKGRPSLIREAPPNHPIYKRGYVVGGQYSRSSATGSAKKTDQLVNKQQPRLATMEDVNDEMFRRFDEGMLHQVTPDDATEDET